MLWMAAATQVLVNSGEHAHNALVNGRGGILKTRSLQFWQSDDDDQSNESNTFQPLLL